MLQFDNRRRCRRLSDCDFFWCYGWLVYLHLLHKKSGVPLRSAKQLNEHFIQVNAQYSIDHGVVELHST